MEALTAVSVACLTIYDMLKAVDRGMRIEGVELVEKQGGKSGDWRRRLTFPRARGKGSRANRERAMSESKLLSVDEALARVLSDATRLGEEDVPLGAARGRTLAQDLVARRTQPPIDVSAMDGYALRAADLAAGPLKLVGESAAGHGYGAPLNPGEAVRIFTGAPVPAGADAILLQEDAETADGALRAKPRRFRRRSHPNGWARLPRGPRRACRRPRGSGQRNSRSPPP